MKQDTMLFQFEYMKMNCISCYLFRNIVIVLHCSDGIQNRDESNVDCGGSCTPCKGVYFQTYFYNDSLRNMSQEVLISMSLEYSCSVYRNRTSGQGKYRRYLMELIKY